jgi:hypothetical protein
MWDACIYFSTYKTLSLDTVLGISGYIVIAMAQSKTDWPLRGEVEATPEGGNCGTIHKAILSDDSLYYQPTCVFFAFTLCV